MSVQKLSPVKKKGGGGADINCGSNIFICSKFCGTMKSNVKLHFLNSCSITFTHIYVRYSTLYKLQPSNFICK